MHVCVWNMHVSVWICGVCVYVYIHESMWVNKDGTIYDCGSQRLVLNAFFYFTPLYNLRQGLSLELDFTECPQD